MDEGRLRVAEERLWASVGVTPTERRVRLERTGVSVRVQEVGEGPPVVFVHGASNSGTSWAPLAARLEGFRCVLLDRPGCGLSEPLGRRFREAADLVEYGDDLVVDLLDGLELESADIVGTSYGGWFSLRAGGAHADRVRRVVVLGWMLGVAMARLPVVMRVGGIPLVGRLMAAVPPTRGAVRALFRQIGLRSALAAGRIPDEVIVAYQSLLRDTDTMANELKSIGRLLSPFRGVDPELVLSDGYLAGISAPVHFLWGEEDPFGDPEEARRVVAALPHAELELMPGAGHAVWLDDPDHVAAVTRHFLGSGA